MNLFGCKFCRRNPIDNTVQCDRKNFDSLLWALVTVFQVSVAWLLVAAIFHGRQFKCHCEYLPDAILTDRRGRKGKARALLCHSRPVAPKLLSLGISICPNGRQADEVK